MEIQSDYEKLIEIYGKKEYLIFELGNESNEIKRGKINLF
jgi:hypothetical protein